MPTSGTHTRFVGRERGYHGVGFGGTIAATLREVLRTID